MCLLLEKNQKVGIKPCHFQVLVASSSSTAQQSGHYPWSSRRTCSFLRIPLGFPCSYMCFWYSERVCLSVADGYELTEVRVSFWRAVSAAIHKMTKGQELENFIAFIYASCGMPAMFLHNKFQSKQLKSIFVSLFAGALMCNIYGLECLVAPVPSEVALFYVFLFVCDAWLAAISYSVVGCWVVLLALSPCDFLKTILSFLQCHNMCE
jgi:hypothetical protein